MLFWPFYTASLVTAASRSYIPKANLPGSIEALGPNAFVIERLDRRPGGKIINIEYFAQVFEVYPDSQYKTANMLNVARLQEFVLSYVKSRGILSTSGMRLSRRLRAA